MAVAAAAQREAQKYRGLRGWLEQVEKLGELERVSGASWDVEMGAITQMLTEKSRGTAPAILFDDVPGYPKGYRTLYGQLSSIRRIALTLGLPLDYERKVDIVQRYHARMGELKPLPPRFVNDGPIFENVIEGDAVDVLKFPVPRHHEADKARFIGTACAVVTKDPDDGWYNLGAYRSQVYDGKTVGCQITEGKHGRIHRDKYFARGEPMKVVILCGQDPLLFMLSSSPLPEVSEYDIAGGLRGEPIDVVRGPYTGFPIPADCEIAIEGETVPGQTKPEGPFGEWMGYYSDDTQDRPYVNVKTILHRNDPILTCAPQHKPVDETGLLKGIAGAAQIWRALDACGIPDVLGVWNHEAGPATRFTTIQLRQRYPGHARQALHVACACQGGAYAGKWTVVVDDDIDAGDLDQVLWAMCTRFDPKADIDLVQKAWASKRDPLYLPGNFNNRILIDACIPYDMKLKGTFPPTVDVSADLRGKAAGEVSEVVSLAARSAPPPPSCATADASRRRTLRKERRPTAAYAPSPASLRDAGADEEHAILKFNRIARKAVARPLWPESTDVPGGRYGANLHPQRGRPVADNRYRRSRHAAPLRAARRTRIEQSAVRLWARPMRRLHGAYRRPRRPLLHHAVVFHRGR